MSVNVPSYLGDYDAGDVINVKFLTTNTSQVPVGMLGSPTATVYVAGTSTPVATGLTLTVNYNSVTGLNDITITTASDAVFYAIANDFSIVISAGTVNSVSVVGTVVACFSIRNRAPLYPTTPGQTLGINATGQPGVDWNNIANPTTTVNLSGTTVATATAIAALLPTALSGGYMKCIVESYASGQAPLQPATAGRTLLVNASGGAAIDWGQVQNPTSTVGMTATTIKQASDQETQGAAIIALLPTSLVGGKMNCSVGGYQSGFAPLQPTVGGNTLNVTTMGNAGIDWATIENPGTTQNLSATTISTATAIASTLSGISARIPTSLGGGYMKSIVESYGSGQAPLQPTTPGNTLDVSAAGGAGLDWSNIKAPTTTVGLTGTSILNSTDQNTQCAAIIALLPASLSGGYMKSIVESYASGQAPLQPTVSGNTLDVSAAGGAGLDWANIKAPTTTVALTGTTVATATHLTNAPTAGDFTATMKASLNAATPASIVGSVGGDVTGRVIGNSSTNFSGAGVYALNAAGAALAVASTALSTAVWTNARGANLDNLNATVSSRLATSGYTAPNNTGITTIISTLGTPAGASVSADIAQIESQTVNLPAEPAATGDAMTLTSGALTSVANSVWGAAVESGVTFLQAMRAMAASLAGVLSGAAGTTVSIQAIGNPGTTRVQATVDSSGDRSAVTLTL